MVASNGKTIEQIIFELRQALCRFLFKGTASEADIRGALPDGFDVFYFTQTFFDVAVPIPNVGAVTVSNAASADELVAYVDTHMRSSLSQ